MNGKERFIILNKQVFSTDMPGDYIEILKDTITGVLYIYRHYGNSGGLTVLVDANGKPQVDLNCINPSQSNETGYLNENKHFFESKNTDSQHFPRIIREKTKEEIKIDKSVFRIGKEKSYVDYCIDDNAAISRSHVNIICKDGKYYIVDTNSTNHTYINGTMIGSNIEMPIYHQTIIRLANENFKFLLS